MNSENKFTYTYSAAETEEIKKIRNKYSPKEQHVSTLEQLRKLDQKVERPGTIAALIIGIIGTLIFGTGMCCVLVWEENLFFPGILIGIIGLAVAGAAYPVYLKVTQKQKEKIAPIILKLTENITNM